MCIWWIYECMIYGGGFGIEFCLVITVSDPIPSLTPWPMVCQFCLQSGEQFCSSPMISTHLHVWSWSPPSSGTWRAPSPSRRSRSASPSPSCATSPNGSCRHLCWEHKVDKMVKDVVDYKWQLLEYTNMGLCNTACSLLISPLWATFYIFVTFVMKQELYSENGFLREHALNHVPLGNHGGHQPHARQLSQGNFHRNRALGGNIFNIHLSYRVFFSLVKS